MRPHGRVKLDVHIPDPTSEDHEEVISVELLFHLPDVTRQQLPFVMALTYEVAQAQQALVTALVDKGIFEPMTSAQKAEALKAVLGQHDRRN